MDGFDWFKGFILPYANFAIFLGLAYFFFGKQLRRYAAGRKNQYEQAFAEAKKLREQAEFQARQVQERLANLDDEVEQILKNARSAADQEAMALVEDAERLAEHIRDEAKKIAETELQQAKENLQNEIVGQVAEKVRQRLETQLDVAQQSELLAKKTNQVAKLNLGSLVEHG